MPNRPVLRVLVRAGTVFVAMVATAGVLLTPAGRAAPSASATPRSTTSTTAAPPITVPPTTTPTSAAPAPAAARVRTTTPTTARPTTTAPKPAARAQAARVPSGTPEERGQQALALVSYPWQKLGYTFSFEPGQTGYLGLTDSASKVIRIFVRNNESMDTLERTIGHELGHALDFTLTSDDERANYIAIRGINATVDTWYGCNACEDYSTAAGDWAETFQYYLFGPGQYFSKMGPPPNADQLARLAPIFAAQ